MYDVRNIQGREENHSSLFKMGKGRKFVPNQNRDGDWYKFKTKTKTTDDLKEPVKFPVIFQKKIKNNSKEYPFSTHDNRNSLQDKGEYFGNGLGKRIVAERSQHISNIQPHHSTQSNTGSTYQASYQRKEGEPCRFRRYPRQYSSPFLEKTEPSTTTTKWWRQNEPEYITGLHVLALTQEPHSKPNKWRYSFGPGIFSLIATKPCKHKLEK